ncbi:unnamed protein product [Chondrus crispus]|uniref:Uncharacterized protein n=1 Tax=Chondrus crispus TaxID=2769 RepID=R7QIY0_CHOCR|nr:unnamed protein product [Chondrus crispus]CDF38014.1 unnamed protein product [Chondrus crispus]|eukprot:XP_005717883.1 unnamed protein product [Chondrus crispus]
MKENRGILTSIVPCEDSPEVLSTTPYLPDSGNKTKRQYGELSLALLSNCVTILWRNVLSNGGFPPAPSNLPSISSQAPSDPNT